MLEEHSNSSNNNTLKHSLALEQSTHSDKLEFKDISSSLFLQMRETFSQRSFLEKRLGLDLEEFKLDEFVVGRKVTEVGEDLSGFFFAAVVKKPSR